MTAISAASTSDFSTYQRRIADRLNREVQSGAISAEDGQAIGTALRDLEAALAKEGAAAKASSQNSSGPSSTFKDKITALIDAEVAAGKLSAAQAKELRSVLGGHQSRGVHGAHYVDAALRPDGGNPLSDTDGDDGLAPLPAAPTTTNGISELLQQFLKILQDAQKTVNTVGYGASGSATLSPVAASLGALDKKI
jgi:hypothetical protein